MKIFYLRDERKFPVACVASKLEEGRVVFAVSAHNPKDPFDKIRAREVAAGRLHSKQGVLYTATPEELKEL